jgi:hypothetical protein
MPARRAHAAWVGDCRRFTTGDARRAGDAEALNLSHPLVTAAVGHARLWTGGGAVTLDPAGASPKLLAVAGKVGVMRVVMVGLVVGATVGNEPLDPELAAELHR